MTTLDTHPDAAVTTTGAPSAASRALTGVAETLTTTDHKRIGGMMIDFGLLFGLAVMVIGALLGFERVDTGSVSLDADSLNQLFSMFRVGLVFMVVIPIGLGVAMWVVPLQIGSRSLSFSRAAALGFWTWLTGTGLVIAAYADNGGPGGGSDSSVDLFLAGLALAIIGLLVAAGSVATTVLTSRAPGMYLDMVPMTAWSALVGAVTLLLTLPVLLANLIYLFVDHRYGVRTAVEDNGWGGNANIHDWMRSALTQPQSYIYAVLVLGLFAELVPVVTHSRMRQRGVVLAGVGIFATAALAGITQTNHTIGTWRELGSFDKVQEVVPYLFFNALPALGLLIVLGGGARLLLPSLRSRSLSPSAPLLYGVGALAVLGAGVTAQLLTPIEDLHLDGTVYEEGVLTMVTYSLVIAGMGAVVYWGPKFFARKMPTSITALLGLGATGAAFLASLPYLVAGFNNQPGIWGVDDAAQLVTFPDNDAAPGLMNFLVGLGHSLMALVVVSFMLVALRSFTKGDKATGDKADRDKVGDDPWDGQTLEWATSSPPPDGNFVDLPHVRSAEPLVDQKLSRSDA